jgi:UV DNA damage repair endonuclease
MHTDGGSDVDLMIEAKDKEQAVLHLYRIYDLAPVIHGLSFHFVCLWACCLMVK